MSRSRHVLLGSAILLLAAASAAKPAVAAVWHNMPGATCQSTGYTTTYATPVLETSSGAMSTPAGTGYVVGASAVCPLDGTSITTAGYLATYEVRYSDSSTEATGALGSVVCSVSTRNYSGTVWNSGSLYSCSTSGGCTTPNNSYTGSGYLLWSYPLSATGVETFWGSCYIPNNSSKVYSTRAYY